MPANRRPNRKTPAERKKTQTGAVIRPAAKGGGPVKGGGKFSAFNVQVIEDWRRIFALRVRGHSFPEIADELGMSVAHVQVRIQQAYSEFIQEDVERARQTDLVRLDALIQVVWPTAMQGKSGAIREIRELLKQRADLMGLQAPRKVEGTLTVLPAELERIRAERWEQLKDTPVGKMLEDIDGTYAQPEDVVSSVETGGQGDEHTAGPPGADEAGGGAGGQVSPDGPDHAGNEAGSGPGAERTPDADGEGEAGGDQAQQGDLNKDFDGQVRFADIEESKKRLPARYHKPRSIKASGPERDDWPKGD